MLVHVWFGGFTGSGLFGIKVRDDGWLISLEMEVFRLIVWRILGWKEMLGC